MADQNGATGTQADPETQPPAGTAATQVVSPDGDPQPTPESISLEEAKKLRSEASSLRRRLKELEEAERQRTEAGLTETQRLQKRVEELEAEKVAQTKVQQEKDLRIAALTAATKLGFTDPQDALALLDRDAIEIGPDGQPTNLAKLLSDLARAKSYLLSTHTRPTGSADGGARDGASDVRSRIAAADADGDYRTAIALRNRQVREAAARKG